MKYTVHLISRLAIVVILLSFSFESSAQISSNAITKDNINDWYIQVKLDPTDDPFREAEINCFYVYRNELYASGNFQGLNYKKLNSIAKFDGVNWTQVGDIDKDVVVNSLVEYKGELYAGGNWGIKKWNGSKWISFGMADEKKGYSKGQMLIDESSNGTLAVKALCVYKDELYAGGSSGISGTSNASLLRWDGKSWRSTKNKLLELKDITTLAVFNDELYVGCNQGWTNRNESEYYLLLKWNGVNATRISFEKPKGNDYDLYHTSSLLAYDDYLYITYGNGGGQGGGIIKYDGTSGKNIYNEISVRSLIVFRNKIFFHGSYIDRLLIMEDSGNVKMFTIPITSNRGVFGVYMNKLYGMYENKQ